MTCVAQCELHETLSKILKTRRLELELSSNSGDAGWSYVGRRQEAGSRGCCDRLNAVVIKNVVEVKEACRDESLLENELLFGSNIEQGKRWSSFATEWLGEDVAIYRKGWLETSRRANTGGAEVSAERDA